MLEISLLFRSESRKLAASAPELTDERIAICQAALGFERQTRVLRTVP